MERLQMIGQAVFRLIEIEALVLKSSAEKPIAPNQKTVVVAKIFVKRGGAAKAVILVITAEGVGALGVKNVARVLLFGGRPRLRLDGGSGKGETSQAEKESENEQA